MAARFAWVLNLDADVELAAIATGYPAYTPKQSTRDAMRAFVPKLAASLLDPERDVLVDEESPALMARGLVGRAFCPTPRALRILRRAGAEPEPHPSCDVLVRVNARAFASSLGTTLPGAVFATSEEEARAVLARPPPPELSEAWRVKRNFGMTGRGQRVIVPGALSEQDAAFMRAGHAEGGVQIEPNVAIDTEYAIHGRVDALGSLELGAVTRQHCDARGAWVSSERVAPEAAPQELEEEALRVAAALTNAGYFGPFGIDAYTYRVGATRELSLQPRSEINARYTMGFRVPV
jgi:hypothetical protein